MVYLPVCNRSDRAGWCCRSGRSLKVPLHGDAGCWPGTPGPTTGAARQCQEKRQKKSCCNKFLICSARTRKPSPCTYSAHNVQIPLTQTHFFFPFPFLTSDLLSMFFAFLAVAFLHAANRSPGLNGFTAIAALLLSAARPISQLA